MLTSKLLVCGETIIRDGASNYISIVNLFEDIVPMGYPVFLPRFTILHILERTLEEPEVIHSIVEISINDQQIFSQPLEEGFQGKKRTRSIIQLTGVPINNPGLLKVTVTPENTNPITYTIELLPPVEVQTRQVEQAPI